MYEIKFFKRPDGVNFLITGLALQKPQTNTRVLMLSASVFLIAVGAMAALSPDCQAKLVADSGPQVIRISTTSAEVQ
eukprot:g44810.t1